MVAIINHTGRRVILEGKDRDVWGQNVCTGLEPGETCNATFGKLSSFYRLGVIAEDGKEKLGFVKRNHILESESIDLSWSDSGGLIVATEPHRKPSLLRRFFVCVRFGQDG